MPRKPAAPKETKKPYAPPMTKPAREKMYKKSPECFLLPPTETEMPKFPICEEAGKPTRRGVVAAQRRAILSKHPEVVKKTKAILKKAEELAAEPEMKAEEVKVPTTGAGMKKKSAWATFYSENTKGKKFGSVQAVREHMKKLAAEFKAKK